MFPVAHTTVILFSRKLKLALGHFVFLLPLYHYAKKGVTLLAGETTREKLFYFSTMETWPSTSEIQIT